ncbi:MAG: DUF2254 domain-containing protein [Myxococcales bacterium]|nr:DUF2254 domain-containing protein [Myxococcales bacterium]
MAAATTEKRRQIWIYPIALLGASAAIIFVSFYLIDWWRWAPAFAKPSAFSLLFTYEAGTAQNALGNLAQVVTAVLGIVITVVSIVVQLAATRYTPRVAEMFFRDRTNLAVLGFFVVAGIDAVWVSLSVSDHFVPEISIAATLILVTLSVLLMVPYFAYVFAFLDPERVVSRIQEQALASALSVAGEVPHRQLRVLQSIEQLTDVAMNAITQKDKLIAQGAVDALKELAASYLPRKLGAETGWFEIGPKLRQNPDFVSMSGESVDDLAQRKVWLEWKVLRQYQTIYNESLGVMQDMNHLVAIDTRYIGEAALAVGDRQALGLVVKFFNTYLRATLNEKQVRVAYNVLNQYRQLCERMIEAGLDDTAVEVAGHLRYYGQLAHSFKLRFVTETVGYDIATLCEVAFARKAPCHDRVLRVLLELDHKAETEEQEQMLRGVRKAQAKLATFYLVAGEERPARSIADDMQEELPARLRSIRDELLGITSKDFWEVIDRGTNFDYLDAPRKEKLREFFGWFPSLRPQTPPVGSAIG